MPDTIKPTIAGLLAEPSIRRTAHGGQTLYAAVDLVAALTIDPDPAARVTGLKQQQPQLSRLARWANFGGDRLVGLPMAGVLLLVGSLTTPAARQYHASIATAAARDLAGHGDAAHALPRTHRHHAGHAQPWIDRRVSGVHSRQDLTAEWHDRGAVEGEDYRMLTNVLFEAAFGKNVADLRAAKGMARRFGANLRDHMSETELLLTTLAESTAVSLMRDRDSRGMEALLRDAIEAGRIVAGVRQAVTAHPRDPGRPASAGGNRAADVPAR